MKNLFETKEWNRDNLRLICGDLYACMNGQQWVLLWDEVDGDTEITDWNSLRFRSWDSTYTMYITDDRRVKVYKDFEFLLYITFDEMVDRTYSKYFNDDSGVVLNLFESELNRDVDETVLCADNKPYMTLDGDDWGEPEKEEKVSIKEYDNGIEVKMKPKEGFTSLWNKVRKDILGIKTPSERFEENMKDFKWCDEETLKKFDKNLRDAMRLKDDRKKTLNEIRKEHGFEDTVTRETTDNKPQTLREMVQPVLDELRDSERYAWQKYADEVRARLNHDMLKAHLNEKLVSDNVNAPDHYKLRGLDIEAIDVIRGALTEDEFRGFCKGNVLKYTIREGHKNGDEDLKKAKKYLEFLEEDDSDE